MCEASAVTNHLFNNHGGWECGAVRPVGVKVMLLKIHYHRAYYHVLLPASCQTVP